MKIKAGQTHPQWYAAGLFPHGITRTAELGPRSFPTEGIVLKDSAIRRLMGALDRPYEADNRLHLRHRVHVSGIKEHGIACADKGGERP